LGLIAFALEMCFALLCKRFCQRFCHLPTSLQNQEAPKQVEKQVKYFGILLVVNVFRILVSKILQDILPLPKITTTTTTSTKAG
jgi:hypothetical protein